MLKAKLSNVFVVLVFALLALSGRTLDPKDVELLKEQADETIHLSRRDLLSTAEIDELCSSITDTCDLNTRHVVFLVDASLTMDPDNVNNEIFEYLQRIPCIFDSDSSNMLGLITFNEEITVQIPLGNYTHTQWYNMLEDLKDDNICCSCCTPLAEAFDAAAEQFDTYSITGETNLLRTTVVITDGVPFQNGGYGKYERQRMPHAYYKAVQVPKSADKLKDEHQSRVMVINVPRFDKSLEDMKYFAGELEGADARFCSKNGVAHIQSFGCPPGRRSRCCLRTDDSPFPIISAPIESNRFTLESFDNASITELLVQTQQKLCFDTFIQTCFGPPRDVIFIVDASNSIDPVRFQNEIMDLVVNAFQSLNSRPNNRVGMVLFGFNARIVIPLDSYTTEEFETRIDVIRNDNVKELSSGSCCACCTPTAEAFEKTKEHFENNPSCNGAGCQQNDRIAFMISDGVPKQLNDNSKWSSQRRSEAVYTGTIVPRESADLQEIARVAFLGVLSKKNNTPDADYFRDNDVVSAPVNDNIFTVDTWDLKSLTDTLFTLLCVDTSLGVANTTEEETYIWEGGWRDSSGDCATDYYIKEGGQTLGPFNGCLDITEHPPFFGKKSIPTLFPGTDLTAWCPYNLPPNNAYNRLNRRGGLRKRWGFCRASSTPGGVV